MIHVVGFTPWYEVVRPNYIAPINSFNSGRSSTSLQSMEVRITPFTAKLMSTMIGVATEWQTAKILSAYNAFIDADACCINSMTSASFFQHYPLASRHVQNPKPTSASLIRDGYLRADGSVVPRTYLMFYVGDYDSAAWLYSQLKSKWDDPARGSVPLGNL